MDDPRAMFGLAPAWRLAFEEAWTSFCAGSFGIGAVLVDPDAEDAVVSVGRNRVAQVDPELRTLSGNMTAHAEMNAFAALDRFNAEGLHLYTTLEPCLMCIGTAMQLKVGRVHYAAADEFYVGMDQLWAQHPVTAERYPPATGPLATPLADFARLLPMAFTLKHFGGRTAEQQARSHHPHLAEIIDRLDADATFEEIKRSGSIDDALDHLAPALRN
jgi:tRNA(Arg) A34 adenosine deaminase TadA